MAAQAVHGVPRPNAWATTHLLFDWAGGPVRRGLFGEVLRHLLGEQPGRRVLDAVAFAVALACVGLLLEVGSRASKRADPAALLLLAATFTGSVAARTLALSVGYLDHVGLLLTLACLVLPHRAAGDAARLGLCVVGVLVHEAFVLAFLPVVVLDVLVHDGGERGRGPAPALLLGVVVVALGAWLAERLKVPPEQIPALLDRVRARAGDVGVEAPAVDVLMREGWEGPVRMRLLWSDPARWALLARNGALTLTLAGVYAGIALRGTRGLVAAAVVAAVAGPLLLHAFAWDLCRFDALSTLGALLALLVVLGRPGEATRWTSSPRALVVGAAVVGLEVVVVVADLVPVFP